MTQSDDKIEYQNRLLLKVKIEHLSVNKMLHFCLLFFQNKISLILTFFPNGFEELPYSV